MPVDGTSAEENMSINTQCFSLNLLPHTPSHLIVSVYTSNGVAESRYEFTIYGYVET
jgi:hypothetical protein